MHQDSALPVEDRPFHGVPEHPNPTHHGRVEPLLAAPRRGHDSGSSTNFDALLLDIEAGVSCAGNLLLFSGDHLRLEITLLRHEMSPRVIWGLKSHHDWVFKATLLRMARRSEPVHLVLCTFEEGDCQLQGWVVKRTMDSFWAMPLPPEQSERFRAGCLAELALASPRSS